FMVWDRIQTLTGLRDEYLRKKTEIEAKRKQLASLKMASPEWFELHRTLLTDVDALCGWLRSTIFSAAAAQWEKAYGGELKKAGAAASKSRLEESKKIAPFTDLARLEAVCHEAGKGGVKWHARQSKHIRIIAHTGIPIESVNNALTLGERIIEGFRTDFIDAFLEPEERDPIPEEMFEEYLFTPEDHDLGAVLWETFYGKKIGEPREKVYKLNRRGRGGRADFVHLCKTETDLDGFVAHTIGHDLADLAFARGQACPAWMGEGFGYWVSFEHLARNSITCFAFSMPTYAKAAEREGLKQTEEGMRAAFLALALSKGPSMSDLMQTPLVSMEAPDLAKAWSVIDWLVTIERKKLKPFLVGACESEKDGRTNIESFRDDAMKVFDVTSGDVYVQIDEIWRRFAASGGGESKKKKTS
ncbi:MAG TPA: hypothetical protein VEI02_12730, partial [Planctomycetota bacterium]|nr:hypothetical protein [Planctomycetota bacterium]